MAISRLKGPVRPTTALLGLAALLLLLGATVLATPAPVDARPRITVTEYARHLNIPWDIAFTPDGTLLITERGGSLKARLTNGTVQEITHVSGLFAENQAGLLGILVDKGFSTNRRFYTCQVNDAPREVQVVAWTVNDDYTVATRVADPLVGGIPAYNKHVGCRLLFGPQGYLWISTGDAAMGRAPQDKRSLAGKVLRVSASDGSGHPNNPFRENSPDEATRGSPLVYTYGHRNVQGLALRPGTSQMWAVEHGPATHDEINLLIAGQNYGWDPTHSDPDGHDDNGPMTDRTKFPRSVLPTWTSGEDRSGPYAPSGAVFLRGSQWGDWQGRLAVATLGSRRLYIFPFTGSGTSTRIGQPLFVAELDGQAEGVEYSRLRSAVMGPDGALYLTTSDGGNNDYILKVTATNAPRRPPTPPTTTTTTGTGGGFGGGGPVGNQPPQFAESGAVTRSVPEGSSAGTLVGEPVAATDPDGDKVRYRLIGPDREMFDIDADTGQITLASDAPLDHEEQGAYHVRVVALDVAGSGTVSEVAVTITVADVKLPGKANDYDANGNEELELEEVLAAIGDYFRGELTLEEVLAIIELYFEG